MIDNKCTWGACPRGEVQVTDVQTLSGIATPNILAGVTLAAPEASQVVPNGNSGRGNSNER